MPALSEDSDITGVLVETLEIAPTGPARLAKCLPANRSPAVFKDAFQFSLAPPPSLRGVPRDGPDRRFPLEAGVLDRMRGWGG